MVRKSPYVLLGCLGAALTLAWYFVRDTNTRKVVSSASTAQVAQPAPVTSALLPALPAKLDRLSIDPASRDPFLPFEHAMPPKAAPLVIAPTPVQAIVTPIAPPLDVRFVGRTVDVDGKTVVFVQNGGASMPLTVGQVLTNGYRVVALSEKAIDFEYPPMGITTQLPLPAQPLNEIR